jgi:hypothetical protein
VEARGNSSVEAWENSSVEAWGISSVEAWENSRVEAWENSRVVARENSRVVARENSSVIARENSRVEAMENSSVEAWGNSSVEAWENSSVEARENSSVEAWENSRVEAWGNSRVVAWENSSVEAWVNSRVVAWENSRVEARGNSVVRLYSTNANIVLYGFSVCFVSAATKNKILTKSKTAIIQKFDYLKFLEREGIEEKNDKVILFKRVSEKFLTQENTKNETEWAIGKTIIHPGAWNPATSECGEGKFHACSRPYFADRFRSEKSDKYIAIEIKTKDLFQWKNPIFPHKIAFRAGKVLYECDRFGNAFPI